MAGGERRNLPPVHAVLRATAELGLEERWGREYVVRAVREAVDDAREALASGATPEVTAEALAAAARARLVELTTPGPRRVINATGVVLHTGLGRAPLPLEGHWGGYSDLEVSRETGERGDRQRHTRDLLRWITGAEDALVVNNNAAATLLAIAATAAGGEVVIARGQLVEIGGSFRMPEVIAASGARLVEVGATNRVRLDDYAAAIGPTTRAILEVHTSNYRIRGFTEQPATDALARLAHEAGLPLIYDVGSGCLLDSRTLPGLEEDDAEPTVPDAVAAGADIVCFSGDKLLGGPQAGILVGGADWIRLLGRHPLARALRADKLALRALASCLAAWVSRDAADEVPAVRLLSRTVDEVRAAADGLAARLAAVLPAATVRTTPGASAPGSGSLPDTELASWWVRVRVADPDGAARALRLGEPGVFALVRDGEVVLDARTILPGEEEDLTLAWRNLTAGVARQEQ
jgi:L-seryl-tRNA(Ser) seleniumtransferase